MGEKSHLLTPTPSCIIIDVPGQPVQRWRKA